MSGGFKCGTRGKGGGYSQQKQSTRGRLSATGESASGEGSCLGQVFVLHLEQRLTVSLVDALSRSND